MRSQSSRRVNGTEEIQGVDSFIRVTSPTIAELDEVRDAGKTDVEVAVEGEAFYEHMKEIARKHVVEWNWGADGKPFPQVNKKRAVIGKLQLDELVFIYNAILKPDQKN